MPATLIALIASLWLNAVLFILWIAAGLKSCRWQDRFDALRRNSHRRDPRTGRLMPMGE